MGDDPDRTLTRPARKGGAGAGGPSIQLRIVFPRTLASIVPFGGKELALGRQQHAGLDDASVSRKHASLKLKGAGVEIKDESSRNGTWLDGARLGAEARFAPPDSILRLGDVIGVIELVERDDDGVELAAVPGDAPRTRAMRRQLARLARGQAPVLLLGETGTGKERVAREIHRLSNRGTFVAFNCAGLTRDLADSQLFGHKRGAFTGATEAREGLFRRASGGTLLLDEVAELAPEVQSKLLRALETGTILPLGQDDPVSVDVRTIAATHPDLDDRVTGGRFRRDLYARLAMAELSLPALRERRGDVPEWISLFDARWCASEGGAPLAFSSDAMEALMLEPWPENLRGLDRAVYQLRCELEDSGRAVEPSDLPRSRPSRSAEIEIDESDSDVKIPKPSKEDLARVLEENEGSIRATAKHFGRDRRQIYRWMQAYGLDR